MVRARPKGVAEEAKRVRVTGVVGLHRGVVDYAAMGEGSTELPKTLWFGI